MLDKVPEPLLWTTTGGFGIAIAGLLTLLIRRTLSRDNTAIRGDRAESAQFARMEAEIKHQTERADACNLRADRAYDERNKAIERAAEAVAKVTALEIQIQHLSQEVHSLRTLLSQHRRFDDPKE